MRYKSLLTVGFIGAAIGIFFAMTQPLYRTGQQLETILPVSQRELEEKQNLKRRLDELRETVANIEDDAKRIEQIIPEDASLAELLVSLEVAAQQTGLTLRSVGLADTGTAIPQFSGGRLRREAASPKGYEDLSIQMTANGTYEGLQAFLDALEHNVRLVDISTIGIDNKGGEGGAGFEFAITVTVYHLK